MKKIIFAAAIAAADASLCSAKKQPACIPLPQPAFRRRTPPARAAACPFLLLRPAAADPIAGAPAAGSPGSGTAPVQEPDGRSAASARVVNGFLLMSQLKASMVVAQRSRVSLTELCLQCTAEDKLPPSLLKIMLQPEDGQPEVWVDGAHVRTIMRNLLGNAVKYNRAPGIFTVALARQPEGVCLRVINETDEPVENTDRLEDEFTRTGSLKEGFGLGLWIAEQLCRLNDAVLPLAFRDGVFISEVLFRPA